MFALLPKNGLFFFCALTLFGGFLFIGNPSNVKAQVISENEFLTPPYFGTQALTALFDHEYPTKYTRMEPPDIDGSLINRDGSRETIPDDNPCARYSGHAGIDYGLVYDYVLASHDGEVIYAGWGSPENRRTGLGLHIEIEITRPNHAHYRTRYGHLSTLLVETNENINQKTVIGISGNTGNSSGPHLHFEVQKRHIPNNTFYPVNPYGWAGTDPDPWENAMQPTGRPASVNLWQHVPSITSPDPNRCSYPSGAAVQPSDAPPLTPDLSNSPVFVIDDNDARFSSHGGPWFLEGCAGLPACYGNTYRYMTLTSYGGFAMWTPQSYDLVTGQYDVYASIPNTHANTVLAYYQIYHNDKVHTAGIDQSRFNQGAYSRNWAYLGRYDYNNSAAINPQLAI